MKIKRFLFLISLVSAGLIVSCDTEDLETCDSQDLSDDFSCPADVDAVTTFCSDGITNSYYTFQGEKYECSGVDYSTCDTALQAISKILIENGCSGKKSGTLKTIDVELSAMAENLLKEVREKSLCN